MAGHSGAQACISKSGSAVPGAFLCLTYFQKNNICFGGTQHGDIIYPFKNSKTLTNPQRMFPPQLSWSLGIQAAGSKNLLSATPSPGRCPELQRVWGRLPTRPLQWAGGRTRFGVQHLWVGGAQAERGSRTTLNPPKSAELGFRAPSQSPQHAEHPPPALGSCAL